MSDAPTPTGSNLHITGIIHRLEAEGYACDVRKEPHGVVWHLTDKDGRVYFVGGKDDYECVMRLSHILGINSPS